MTAPRLRHAALVPLVPCVLWLGLAAAVAADTEAAERPEAALAIGVAPFETMAPPGGPIPDLAALLVQRLRARGVGRVVGPEALGAEPLAEPSAEAVRAWAQRAGVAALVVGRTTRIGNQLSVDVRLRAGDTGTEGPSYVAEIPHTDQLARAIDRLAAQVIEGSGSREEGLAAASDAGSSARFGMGFQRDAPISIESEELEAFQNQGARRLVFSKHVRVAQADVKLTSDRLEAFYPQNASQPERLVATGNVLLVQREPDSGTEREARCERATYDRSDQRIVCSGSAELREGSDVVRGDVIEFDIASERVTVKGGASILLSPAEDAAIEGAGGR